MIDKVFVERKLDRIESYSEELEEIFESSPEEIKNDFLKYRSAERILQLIVDEIIDINNHLIKRDGLEVPDDFQGTFSTLAENEILPKKFAQRIAPVVGLRNKLVHRYEKIDLDLFLRTLQKEREDFNQYVNLIYEYLENRSSTS